MDVKTAGRTVDLFEVFANARTPLTLSEIARALEAPQSSCFNLVRALEARGFLYAVGGRKRVYPTRKLFDMAGAIVSFDPLVPRLQPILDRLRDLTQETTILGARKGDGVVYLAVAEGRQTIRYISRAGDVKPIHSSAIGKALLSTMEPADREKLIRRVPKPQITSATITSVEMLEAEIVRTEERGYATTSGENVADVMAVAVPFRIDGGAYAIAVAGPVGRMTDKAAEYPDLVSVLLADIADR